jgi:hypothetical protein
MRTKSKDPFDRALATLLRRVDSIQSCASGMPWYESTAARCNALREALVSSKAIHATDLQKSVEKRILLSKGIF